MTNDELLRELEVASKSVKQSTGGKSGEGSEKRYGQAYYACVRAGLKPALKSKYR